MKRPIYCFCHVPKTGGVFMNTMFRRVHGAAHLDALPRWRNGSQVYEERDLAFDRILYPFVKSIAGHALTPSASYGAIQERFRWVTLLREPKARYVSHYIHHVERHGYKGTLVEWGTGSQQGNHHCATISGVPSADVTIELLRQFHVVGVLEKLDQSGAHFARAMRVAEPEFRRRAVNQQRSGLDRNAIIEANLDFVCEQNAEDLKVYQFVVNDLMSETDQRYARSDASPATKASAIKLTTARLKRNLVYKPIASIREKIIQRKLQR